MAAFLYPSMIFFAIFQFSMGARILLMPFPMGSHIHQLVLIGETLIANGHEVYATSSPTFPGVHKFQKGNVKFILYEAKEKEMYDLIPEGAEMPQEYLTEYPNREGFRTDLVGMVEMCSNPLSDQKFFLSLKSLNFDIAIIDSFPTSRCMYVLAHRLGLPYISSQALHEHWLYRSPMLPSAWPTVFADYPLTEKMNFWERLHNTWATYDWAAHTGVLYIEDDFLKDFFYESTPVPMSELARRSLLWLIDHSHILDYPRPKMPNEVNIGGLTTKPAQPLSKDLEEFANQNKKGFIICTFGSLDMSLPSRIHQVLLESFGQIEYNVMYRYSGDIPKDTPSNVKLHPWLPQNDILGHRNIKLFISHCGAGGQNEALYHGVPIICLPMFGDQPYNAKRVVYHGYGKYLKLFTLTSKELVAAIQDVVLNETYKINMEKASEIFRDQVMTPLETATYWVEHVLKYGGNHLRSHALDMPWYQYIMLDIFALIFVIFVSICVLCVCAIKSLQRCLKFGKYKVE